MSRRTLGSVLALAFALALFPATSHATGGWDLSLTGGVGVPTGDFKDKDKLHAQTGPQAGLDVCYHVNETVALGVDGSWNQNKHGAEGEVEDLGGGSTITANKDKFKAWQFGVHGKYMFPVTGAFKPYGLVGVGIYSLKEDYEYTYYDAGTMTSTVYTDAGTMTSTVYTDESDEADGYFEQQGSRVGFKFGVGGTYMASPTWGLGLGIDYNTVSLDKAKFGDVQPGDPAPPSSAPYISIRGRITYHIMPK